MNKPSTQKPVAGEMLRTAGKAIWKGLEYIRKPFPIHAGYRAAAVLLLATGPLLPFELIEVEPARWVLATIAIALAVWVVLDRVVAAMEIARVGRHTIRVRQLGLKPDKAAGSDKIGSTTWSGLPLLFSILVIVGCTIVVATSSITSSLIHHFGLPGPFTTPSPGRFDVLLYFVDEAARGITFRLFDEFGISVPEKLQLVRNFALMLGMWVYKTGIMLLVVQVFLLWVSSMLTEADPEVKRLSEEIRSRNAEINDLEEQNTTLVLQEILVRQRVHDGRLTKEDEEKLRYYGKYTYDEDRKEQVKKAFRLHNEAIKKGNNGQSPSPSAEKRKTKLEARRKAILREKEQVGWVDDEVWREKLQIDRELGPLQR